MIFRTLSNTRPQHVREQWERFSLSWDWVVWWWSADTQQPPDSHVVSSNYVRWFSLLDSETNLLLNFSEGHEHENDPHVRRGIVQWFIMFHLSHFLQMFTRTEVSVDVGPPPRLWDQTTYWVQHEEVEARAGAEGHQGGAAVQGVACTHDVVAWLQDVFLCWLVLWPRYLTWHNNEWPCTYTPTCCCCCVSPRNNWSNSFHL